MADASDSVLRRLEAALAADERMAGDSDTDAERLRQLRDSVEEAIRDLRANNEYEPPKP